MAQLQSNLRRNGAAVSLEWCTQFLAACNDSSLEQALGQLLSSDLHSCHDSIGCLSTISSPDQDLIGCLFLLQCDELINVAAPAKDRFPTEGVNCSQRMLKLKLTDGVKTISAFEYRPIPCLSHCLPAGTKVVIKGDLLVRYGMMLLQSHNIEVLGGEVRRLEEARRRAVEAWNRPVGGREGGGRDPFREARSAAAAMTPPLVVPLPNPQPPTPVPVEVDEVTPSTDRADRSSFQQPPPQQQQQDAAATQPNQREVIVVDLIDDDDDEEPGITGLTLTDLRPRIRAGLGFAGRVKVDRVRIHKVDVSEEGLFLSLKSIDDDAGRSVRCLATDAMQIKFLGSTVVEMNSIEDSPRRSAEEARGGQMLRAFRGSVVLEWNRDRGLASIIEIGHLDNL